MLITFALMVALPIGQIFGLTTISGFHWIVVLGLTLLPTAVREIGRLFDNIPLIKEQRRVRQEKADKRRNKKQ
jgi:hypothetical protein